MSPPNQHQPAHSYFSFSTTIFGPHIFSITAITPDSDPSVDDWHAFAGNHVYYGSPTAFLYSIARTFVSRAKRAHATGTTWEEFEKEERKIDSMAVARAEVDPVRKRKLVQEGLDNSVRLAVLDELKGRLRKEIWGEEKERVQERRDSKVDEEVALPVKKEVGVDEEEERLVKRFELGPGRQPIVIWKEEEEEKED